MAELVLSAFLAVLFEKLASTALKKLDHYKGLDADIKKLHGSLTQIQDLLADASQKELTNQSVKRWLNDLQHLAYDIDDVLDDLATEAMHREFTHKSEPITSKVRKLIPVCCMNFARTHGKLDDIMARLHDLVEKKGNIGLSVKEETRSKDINRRLQTSIVHASSIVGRQAEKEALVQKLLRDEGGDQNFSIVPIVGMGGVGKTTLARLVYDEQQVKDYFELKAWVCVSDEFDSFGISKVIYQSVTGVIKQFADLNLLQVEMINHLRNKRFLLVLDDVWSESCQDWETLVGPFHACARGSKVIMTTRKDKLLKLLGYSNLTQLRSLSHDDALSLVALYSLGVNNFDSHLSLKPYGVGIVEKCAGLPLALKAVGRLLGTKKDEEEYWKKVLDSEIWSLRFEDEIAPALRLSYQDLSARLKQLFAYCSLFPKDYVFDKEPLVQLWMAEGFVQQSTLSDSTEECLGHEYFDELLSRSFFQHAPNNESSFVMHDLMNDLATSVAGEFSLRVESNTMEEAFEKYRHMSFICEEYVASKKFEAFKRAKSLRTFMAMRVGVVEQLHFYLSNKILVDLLPELPLLRVLLLSGSQISEVPESIGTLRHLRYLNLSKTRITQLPENVCNLYNLETLILFGCRSLAKLPNDFSKLKNLRHLDIRDTPNLKRLPLRIGELKSLQTLSKFIIRGESGFEITKFKDLKNLCGEISIVGLDRVQNASHVQEAKISQKRLSKLKVVWSDVSRNEMLEKEVLNELKPSNNYLEHLSIMLYGGLEFPKWVGDPSFQRLKHVSIRGCKKCTSLPPLGQLRLLKELFIEGLYGVKVVGLELLGISGAFPSLKILSFKNMRGWEIWSAYSGVVFPCLQQLHIDDCPNLVGITLETLPSLNVLKITKCDSGVLKSLVEVASVVTKLEIREISGLNDVVWRGVIEYLGAVEELDISCCNELRYLWESEAVASKVLVKLMKLKVYYCDNLVSLGEKEEGDNCRTNFLTSLRTLEVWNCSKMECCSCPDNIETLGVRFCGSLSSISLPIGGHKLKSLDISICEKLVDKEWRGQKTNANNIISMPMLEDAYIRRRATSCAATPFWIAKPSLLKTNPCPVGAEMLLWTTRWTLVRKPIITSLRIIDCESLETFPDNELPDLTLLTHLAIHNCPSMDASFSCGNWPPSLRYLAVGKLKKSISDWGPQNFPTSLVDLWLYGDDGVSSCSQFSHLLPSSLTSLAICEFEKLELVSTELQHLQSLMFYRCPNLKRLSYPQHLTSLQYLCFDDCPNMMDLPEMLLPSLLSLIICENCPKLKERCSERGNYWPLISHIPHVEIE